MSNDIKGMCLFLGMLGLGYVMLLIVVMALTGAKLLKSIVLIFTFCSFLVSLGLTPQVKRRLGHYLKVKFSCHRQ
jgi:hypothetical protein